MYLLGYLQLYPFCSGVSLPPLVFRPLFVFIAESKCEFQETAAIVLSLGWKKLGWKKTARDVFLRKQITRNSFRQFRFVAPRVLCFILFHDFYDKGWRIFQYWYFYFFSSSLCFLNKKNRKKGRHFFIYNSAKRKLKNRIVSFFDLSDLKGFSSAWENCRSVQRELAAELLSRSREISRAWIRSFQVAFPSTSFFTY